ncbi:MAG: hypothetical protein Phog2KO_11620 [Phototrophicaceae bacterium]
MILNPLKQYKQDMLLMNRKSNYLVSFVKPKFYYCNKSLIYRNTTVFTGISNLRTNLNNVLC